MLRSFEIKRVNIPKYPELKIETFWKIIKENSISRSYFPDYKEIKLLPRRYMFKLLHKIDESFVESLIQDCHMNKRIQPNFDFNEYIEIRPDLMEEIMDCYYYYSSKIELLAMWCKEKRKSGASFEERNQFRV